MKNLMLAAGLALAATSATANDFNVTVTSMLEPGEWLAPLVIVDAAAAQDTMFDGNKMSELFLTVAREGDPRPMNGKMQEAVVGVVLGNAGPPEVLLDGGETYNADIFVVSNTLRFYAKDEACPDCMISGVWDIAMGGGELMLHSYDTGQDEGTGEITIARENVVKVVITAN